MATTALPLLHLLPRIVCAAFFACLPGLVAGIRKDIGLAAPIMCRSTVQGRHLISDDNVLPKNRVTGCKLDLQCCDSYEYCVSCCLNPSRTKETDVLKLKVARPVTSGTYRNVFDFCMGRCRHSSASVVHENAYASDFHHCFLLQQNSSGSADSGSGPRLDGINISIGRSGESCSSVCRAKGQSCVPSRLSVLNKCEILQKYMRCKSGCFSSLGPDQPAQVVDEAPSNLNPGACLYMQMDERLTCDGSHQHTRRLT
uniref:SREBP regulating gene protein n=1 Tax=Oryza nivara TaxID=4536 RepID=A0A0E0J0K9_ORYNI